MHSLNINPSPMTSYQLSIACPIRHSNTLSQLPFCMEGLNIPRVAIDQGLWAVNIVVCITTKYTLALCIPAWNLL